MPVGSVSEFRVETRGWDQWTGVRSDVNLTGWWTFLVEDLKPDLQVWHKNFKTTIFDERRHIRKMESFYLWNILILVIEVLNLRSLISFIRCWNWVSLWVLVIVVFFLPPADPESFRFIVPETPSAWPPGRWAGPCLCLVSDHVRSLTNPLSLFLGIGCYSEHFTNMKCLSFITNYQNSPTL